MPDSLSSRPTAEQLIAHLGLIPLPEEGGYFRET
jgi:predicted cupin superfamily sugar epimerase